METIQTIEQNGQVYAMLFLGRISAEGGTRFVSRQNDEFQIGVIERPAGYAVKPHTHPVQPYLLQAVSEFLYIERGRVKFTIYDEAWNILAEPEVTAGDFLVLLRGGHALEILEECRIVEVKQGPYPGDSEAKVFFPSAA